MDCWGEIGSKWGVNRTVGHAYPVFYLSPEPLNADEIASMLSFSKSSASTCLRELEGWGLLRAVHLRGDGRQYYQAIKEPREMFRHILDERKRREVDPTATVLQECCKEAAESTPADSCTTERLHAALAFFEAMIPLYDELRQLPVGSIPNLVKLKSRLRSLVGRG